MKQKAYHQLILADGTIHRLVAVRFRDDGTVLDFHPLQGEEPFVEWIGGTLDLRVPTRDY